jgi:acyl carrier protein
MLTREEIEIIVEDAVEAQNVNGVTAETPIFGAGSEMDSLSMVEALMLVEEDLLERGYNVELGVGEGDRDGYDTVGSLVDLLVARLAAE